jgi:hypothetical protein
LRPGQGLRFVAVDVDQAHRLLREADAALAQIARKEQA